MSTRKELVEARLRKGWSQEDLAEKVGVRRSTVSERERGVKAPYPVHIQRLCEIFGMSTEELGLHSKHTANLLIHEGSIEDIIAQCTMECVWPDDAEVADLRDLLVPWE